MKVIILSLAATFGMFLSYGQALEAPISSQAPVSQVFLNANFASAEANNLYKEEALYRDRAERNCARYKTQQTVGAVFTGIGGAFLAAGIPMVISGNNGLNNYSYYNQYGFQNPPDYHDRALINGGVACIIVGVASLCYGVPNLIVGSIRYNRNCGGGTGGYYDRDRYRDRSYIQFHTNGTNLAMNF